MRVFVLDAHTIYRRGIAASLRTMDDVDEVTDAGSTAEAWKTEALAGTDVVIVDPDMEGGHEFIRRVHESTNARIVVCSASGDDDNVLAAVQAGAVGYLCKDTLSAETLDVGVHAAETGAGVMAPELLGTLLTNVSRVSREVLEPRGLALTWLTTREKQVLRLVADGHPTREVAQELCYSERTIKNVIHDAVLKLNARTRAQAVAEAVRAGLI